MRRDSAIGRAGTRLPHRPLADRLEQQDRGRRRCVERVDDLTRHRDPDALVGFGDEPLGQSVLLGADDDCDLARMVDYAGACQLLSLAIHAIQGFDATPEQ